MQPTPLKGLYVTLLAIGVGLAALVYLVLFDSLSEEELVQLTALWFFPIVFGGYGLVSQKLIRMRASGRAGSVEAAARMFVRGTGGLGLVVLFPFLMLRWRSPFLVTVAAAVMWTVLLWLFFAVVFPAL